MKLYQAKNYIAIKHFYKKWKWITPDEREEIFDEVAELYAEQKVKNLAQPDVSRQVCVVMNCGKGICKKSRIYCQEHEDDIY